MYSTRLVTDGYGISAGLDDVAFDNPDGGKVLVAYNNGNRTAHFAVGWHGKSLNYRLPPQATVTFKWQ
ncbi:MAG: glycoside hydrolase family 30 beta sandwich domain-containing protein [Solirubrobacteraceae bacterium]